MASLLNEAADQGFATPAAVAISLALAVVVTAVMALSTTALKAARADLSRTQAQYVLAGARMRAAAVLMQSSNQDRVRWDLEGEGGAVEVVAEPEARKLSLLAAAKAETKSAEALSAADPQHVQRRLAVLAASDLQVEGEIALADNSAIWRQCARSLISPYGYLTAPQRLAVGPPKPGPINWRLGQLWRLRVTDSAGWTEDTVVRFTGAPSHPIAVAARRFARRGRLGEVCDAIAPL